MTTERRVIAIVLACALAFGATTVGAEEPAPAAGSASEASAPPDAADASGSATPPAPLDAPAAPDAAPPVADASSRTFAGSIQLDYFAVPTEHASGLSAFRGATSEISLKVTQDFNSNASATLKICFACHGFEAAMGYVELRAANELRVRIGRMTPAFGSFPARHDPANHLTSDKPLPYDMGRMLGRLEWNEGILPAPWVDNGIEVAGTRFWKGGQADYAVWLVSGPKGGPDATDFDFTLSRAPEQYYVDNNDEPALGGRVALTLDLAEASLVTIGASAMAGHYDPDGALAFAVGGADVLVKHRLGTLRAEYLLRWTEMALGDDPDARFKFGPGADGRYADHFVKDGFVLEAEVPFGAVTGIVRWDGLRRAGNVVAASLLDERTHLLRYTLGLGVRLHPKVQLKASGELYQFAELGTEAGVHASVVTGF